MSFAYECLRFYTGDVVVNWFSTPAERRLRRGSLTLMRWRELFGELEGDAAALERQERDLDIADRTRARLGSLSWLDRCAQRDVGLRVAGVGLLHGQVETVASAWLLLHADAATDWLVAVAAVTGIVPSTTAVADTGSGDARGQVERRLTWLNAWSVLSRDRDRVYVVRTDGSGTAGIPARVGRDFVELTTEVGRAELVPYAAIAAVRCPR